MPPPNQPPGTAKTSKRPKLVLIAAVAVVFLGVLAFVALKFMGSDPAPTPPVAQPQTTPPPADTATKTDEPAVTPETPTEAPAETAKADEPADAPAATPSETIADAPKADPVPSAPVEVKPAPPPPASAAFKAWVQNLRVGSVRAGNPPRLQVGGVTYIPGDAVNPQLGIVFDDYDGATRMIRFKDKSTGAIVERRF